MSGGVRNIGTFLTGFLLRPCCAIPAALALLGVGGTGIATALAPYRPWFLLSAAAMFAVSFYLNFVRNRNQAGMVVWAASICVAGGLWLAPELWGRRALGSETRKETAAMSQAVDSMRVPVSGMACNACARRLERVLGQVPGVSQAAVSFDAKEARVTYDPRQVSADGIAERVRKAGFEVGPEASVQ